MTTSYMLYWGGRGGGPAADPWDVRDLGEMRQPIPVYILQMGVKWKQGVVIYMVL